MSRYSLPSQERLKSTKSISHLFLSGKSLNKFPLILRYRLISESDSEGQALVQVAFTVSKKNFKHAVDRNLIKRRMREMHRHHIHPVREYATQNSKSIEMIWIYTAREDLGYAQIDASGKHLIAILSKKLC